MTPELKLAGMTNAFQAQRESTERTSVLECMRRLHKLGYDKMDLGVAYLMFDNPDITDENWYEKACEIRDEAQKLGIEFVQGHLPFRKTAFDPKDPKQLDYLQSATLRAINIAAVCGTKWMVAHPVENPDYPEDAIEEHIAENHRVYADVFNIAMKNNVGIAFENLPRWSSYGRFGASAADLIALVDSYDNPLVKACWDFGHGNLNSGKNQTYDIEKLGSYLKCIHVTDNRGKNDDHLPPFAGQIKWENILKSLKKIGFNGYWIHEVIFQNGFPDDMKDASVSFTTGIAKYMIDYYNNIVL